DFRAARQIEGAAQPLENETLARLPHQDRADLGALTTGKLFEHSPASGRSFKSNRACHRGRNAEPRIAPPPQCSVSREDLERVGGIGRDDRRDSDARLAVIHGTPSFVLCSWRPVSAP